MSDTRKRYIEELQKLAEDVKKLKLEHRQKRPIVIEFSGSPKAGKTSSINSLEVFLKRNGFKVKIIQERASVCPVSDKQSPMFNIWTACASLEGLVGTLEDKKNEVDVLIIDRGIFDALCWFEWLVDMGKMEEEQRNIAENFLLMKELVGCIDIVFSFCVEPSISIQREYANLLTNEPGTIMNERVLKSYLVAMEKTYEMKKSHFHSIFRVDTSNKDQNQVGKEVTEKTLDKLKELLMERVGYFEKSEELKRVLETNNVFGYEELDKYLPELKFDIRDNVEKNNQFLQLIPVATIVNREKNKVLVIRKNENAAENDSPEHGKDLIYVGGHSRYEDQTESMSTELLTVCKMTLKREIKEEIGISISFDNSTPFFVYCPTGDKSKNHMAICFVISIDETVSKLKLDSTELVQNKGRSKSGKFWSLKKINELELEDWSKAILNHYFKIYNLGQMSMFDITMG